MELAQDQMPGEQQHSLTTLGRTCFVAPKATGIVALIIQFAIIIVSSLIAIFFFYHIGGYEYMNWNENSTILEPIYSHKDEFAQHHHAPTSEIDSGLEGRKRFHEDVYGNETDPLTETERLIANMGENETMELMDFTSNNTLYLDFMNTQLDILELIRISTLVYLLLAAIWFVTLIALLLSIKFEILDLLAVNMFALLVCSIYVVIHAIFIGILLYYQQSLTLRSIAIISGSVFILVCTAAIGGIAMILLVGWWQYIVFMADDEKCYCISGIISMIKGNRRQRNAEQDYAMPQITRHNDIPYADAPPSQNFSSF